MTYIISHDEYMGVEANMSEFRGTFRELLLTLNGWVQLESGSLPPDVENLAVDEDDPDGRKVRDIPNEELINLFHEANGDGQPFYQVWCVDERKKVL